MSVASRLYRISFLLNWAFDRRLGVLCVLELDEMEAEEGSRLNPWSRDPSGGRSNRPKGDLGVGAGEVRVLSLGWVFLPSMEGSLAPGLSRWGRGEWWGAWMDTRLGVIFPPR